MCKFYDLESVTGSGKTYAFMQFASERIPVGVKFVLLQPTKLLARRSYNDAIAQYPQLKSRMKLITSETASSTVTGDITEYTTTIGANDGCLLFITHSAFEKMQYWHNKQLWHVGCDEPFNISWHRNFRLAKHRGSIEKMFKTIHVEGDYTRIEPVSLKSIQAMLSFSDRDEIVEHFGDFYNKLLLRHWRLYVDTKRYEKFLAGQDDGFNIFGMMGPELFAGYGSVTLMAANLKRSFMYRYFRVAGCEFTEHRAIANKLRFRTHTNGARLHVHYFTDRLWSKKLRDVSITDAGRTMSVGEVYREEILALFDGGHGALVLKNQDVDGFSFDSATILPSDPRGLNNYMNFDKVAIYSALNPLPAHGKFLQHICKMTVRELHQTILSEIAYQAIGRSSLRDPTADRAVTICVPDRVTADDIIALYPGCRVQQMSRHEVVPGPKKTGRTTVSVNGLPMTSAERVARYRQTQQVWKTTKMVDINELDEIHEKEKSSCNESIIYTRSLKTALLQITSGGSHGPRTLPESGFALSLFKSTPQKDGTFRWNSLPYEEHSLIPTADVIALLQEKQQRVIAQKADNQCLSPSLYDSLASESTDRGLDNVYLARGLWMDFDGGDVTPERAATILQGIECIIYSSFSSTPERPRFRIGFPTVGAMTEPVYRNIMLQLVKLFNDYNYWTPKEAKRHVRSKLHGIDMSKLHCASLFYLPCQSAHTFFYHFHEQRLPIRPLTWIENSTVIPEEILMTDPMDDLLPKPSAEPVTVSSAGKDRLIDRVIAHWHERGCVAGDGHTQFFALACGLARAGCDMAEIQHHLHAQAVYAHNPRERRLEIKALVRDTKVLNARTV